MAEVAIQQTLILATEECYKCGVLWGVTRALQRECRDRGREFFCPNGHGQVYGKPKVKELEEQLAAEQRKAAFERQRREAAERESTARLGQLTKLRRRIERGVCPHCQRTFTNVARHMQTKHKGACAPEGQNG